jgi:hypothetical protein
MVSMVILKLEGVFLIREKWVKGKSKPDYKRIVVNFKSTKSSGKSVSVESRL